MSINQVEFTDDTRLKIDLSAAAQNFFCAVVYLDNIMTEDLANDIKRVRYVFIDDRYVLMASRENIWIGIRDEKDYIRKIKREQYPYTTLLNTYLKETVLKDFKAIYLRDRSH